MMNKIIAARLMRGLGWLVLAAMLAWSVFYVTSQYSRSSSSPVTWRSVRSRIVTPVSISRLTSSYESSADIQALRTRVEAQFRGFATFKNTEEGEVEIVGIEEVNDNNCMETAEQMILAAERLQGRMIMMIMM